MHIYKRRIGFIYLHTGIVTHGTLEGFLMCVFVATMTNELSAGHKSHVTICAFVWPSSWMDKGTHRVRTLFLRGFKTLKDYLAKVNSSILIQRAHFC